MRDVTELDLGSSGLVGTTEVAEILGTSIQYVRKLRYLGYIRPFKLKGTGKQGPVYYRRSDIEAYRDTHPQLGSKTPG